jgi:hypothetical protein
VEADQLHDLAVLLVQVETHALMLKRQICLSVILGRNRTGKRRA